MSVLAVVRGTLGPLVAAALLTSGCVDWLGDTPQLTGTGSPWPEATELFRDDPRWLGSDGANSIPLGGDRVLWVFGDTLVARSPGGSRTEAAFVSNTMAITRGQDPSTASITFHWREVFPPAGPGELPPPLAPAREPAIEPIIPDDGAIAHWPGHGIHVNGTLLLFATRLDRGEGAFGFRGLGWTAFRVTDMTGPPSEWTFERARTSKAFGDALFVGAGSVIVADGFLHAFAVRSSTRDDGWTDHDPHLARWPLDAALAGDLRGAEWYDPVSGSWVAEAALSDLPQPLFRPGSPGFSVHHDKALGKWVQIQSTGFGAAPVQARVADELQGRWSEAVTVFEPPEMADAGLTLYLGVAHPEFTGAPLAVTYSVNAANEESASRDDYYPRFARIELRHG